VFIPNLGMNAVHPQTGEDTTYYMVPVPEDLSSVQLLEVPTEANILLELECILYGSHILLCTNPYRIIFFYSTSKEDKKHDNLGQDEKGKKFVKTRKKENNKVVS
jgi:hypothetical protein